MSSIDRRLHAYLRAAAGDLAVRTEPFTARIDPHVDHMFFSYAIPDDDAEPTAHEVRALTELFESRARTPRLEYLPGCAPLVEQALLAAGFTPERRLPVMTSDPDGASAIEIPPSVDIVMAESDTELLHAATAQADAYGETTDPTEDGIDRLRRLRIRGGLVALALDRSTGEGVGAGILGPPHEGVSELSSVGVRSKYRGRGIAAALTATLTRACRDHEIDTPFLTPDDAAAERIYRRAGYERSTEILHISLQR